MECPVCEHPSVRHYGRLGDRLFQTTAEEFDLYECPGCGLLFQDEAIIRDRLTRFYPVGYWWESSGPWARLQDWYRAFVLRRDQVAFLSSIFPDPANRRLLDIGSGSGMFVQQAAQAGFDAFGLDLSEEACRIAEARSPGRFFCGSEQDLIERGETFEILVMLHCLEHVPSPFQYLKKIQKLLRRPGALVVQVPNRNSFQARILKNRWYGLDCPRHIHNFSTYAVQYLLGRAGFRIHRTRHFSLRDNAASLVSSLAPGIDPIATRVREARGERLFLPSWISQGVYFALVAGAQPLAWTEALLGRGATVTIHATLDS